MDAIAGESPPPGERDRSPLKSTRPAALTDVSPPSAIPGSGAPLLRSMPFARETTSRANGVALPAHPGGPGLLPGFASPVVPNGKHDGGRKPSPGGMRRAELHARRPPPVLARPPCSLAGRVNRTGGVTPQGRSPGAVRAPPPLRFGRLRPSLASTAQTGPGGPPRPTERNRSLTLTTTARRQRRGRPRGEAGPHPPGPPFPLSLPSRFAFAHKCIHGVGLRCGCYMW